MKFTTHGPLHIYFLYDPGHHSIYTLFKLAFCLCVFFLAKKTDKFKFLHTFSFSLSRIFQTRQCLRYYNCYILEDFQTIHKYTWCQMPSWPGSSTARRTAPGCTRPSRTTRPPEFRWGVVVPLPLDPPVPGSNPGPWPGLSTGWSERRQIVLWILYYRPRLAVFKFRLQPLSSLSKHNYHVKSPFLHCKHHIIP